MHDLSISLDFISGPESGSFKEKSGPFTIPYGDESSEAYIKLSDRISQRLFISWEKRPATRQPNQNPDKDLSSQDLVLSCESGRREKDWKC